MKLFIKNSEGNLVNFDTYVVKDSNLVKSSNIYLMHAGELINNINFFTKTINIDVNYNNIEQYTPIIDKNLYFISLSEIDMSSENLNMIDIRYDKANYLSNIFVYFINGDSSNGYNFKVGNIYYSYIDNNYKFELLDSHVTNIIDLNTKYKLCKNYYKNLYFDEEDLLIKTSSVSVQKIIRCRPFDPSGMKFMYSIDNGVFTSNNKDLSSNINVLDIDSANVLNESELIVKKNDIWKVIEYYYDSNEDDIKGMDIKLNNMITTINTNDIFYINFIFDNCLSYNDNSNLIAIKYDYGQDTTVNPLKFLNFNAYNNLYVNNISTNDLYKLKWSTNDQNYIAYYMNNINTNYINGIFDNSNKKLYIENSTEIINKIIDVTNYSVWNPTIEDNGKNYTEVDLENNPGDIIESNGMLFLSNSKKIYVYDYSGKYYMDTDITTIYNDDQHYLGQGYNNKIASIYGFRTLSRDYDNVNTYGLQLNSDLYSTVTESNVIENNVISSVNKDSSYYMYINNGNNINKITINVENKKIYNFSGSNFPTNLNLKKYILFDDDDNNIYILLFEYNNNLYKYNIQNSQLYRLDDYVINGNFFKNIINNNYYTYDFYDDKFTKINNLPDQTYSEYYGLNTQKLYFIQYT